MRAKNIKERCMDIVAQQRAQLEKEIELYEEKMHDTESVYGFGGAYSRQERARDARAAQLEELETFEEQLKSTHRTRKVGMYVIGCNKCNTVFMTLKEPFDDWHECPTCRGMLFVKTPKKYELEFVRTGNDWEDMLEYAIKGGNQDERTD